MLFIFLWMNPLDCLVSDFYPRIRIAHPPISAKKTTKELIETKIAVVPSHAGALSWFPS